MKKKLLIIILLLVTIFIIAGCNNKETKNNKNNEENKTKSNTAVIYFSATGTTKSIAEKIAKESNSDIIEIIPKEKYTNSDLNYNSDCRANREQNDSKSRPEIKNNINTDKYDTIYLGYPIWWGTNPKIILTFLDTYDLGSKTIIPFCTSGSSGIEKSVKDLRDYKPDLNIKDGKRFVANTPNQYIEEFIEENNIKEVVSSMKVIINDKEYTLNLESNLTAQKLVELAPLEITMAELNGNEKYKYLNTAFPVKQTKPGKIEKGDVMLYENGCIVIFYKSFNTSLSYTKIGHIDDLPDLGDKDVVVKFRRDK